MSRETRLMVMVFFLIVIVIGMHQCAKSSLKRTVPSDAEGASLYIKQPLVKTALFAAGLC